MAKQSPQLHSLLAQIHARDVVTFIWLTRRKRQYLWANISRVVSHTADGFYYGLMPLGLLVVEHPRAADLLLALALGFAGERPLYKVLKNRLRRNRPAQAIAGFHSVITPADQFSFPSGHTSGAFLVATVAAGLFPLLFWPLYLWAAAVGAARILLGVHFPTDTLAGATMGTSIGLLALGALKLI